MKKTLITTLVGLFLLGITSTAMATPIVSAIDWLGSNSIGWLKLVTTVTTGTDSYNFDYTYALSFDTDTTHTMHYGEGTGYEYVRHLKILDPLRLPVYEMTSPTGWLFDNSDPGYFIWNADYLIGYNNRLTPSSDAKTFAVHSNYPPGRSTASAWDGGTAAEGGTFTPVPEPTSMLLLGMGVLGLFGLKRKRA